MPADAPQAAILDDRAVLAVGGDDAPRFLGDLITGSVEAAESAGAYAALLSPQGKVLFDFLVSFDAGRYLFDTPAAALDALAARLALYRLRARIDIAPATDKRVAVAWGGDGELPPDPRLAALGGRAVVDAGAGNPGNGAAAYHAHRIALAVPEAGHDFAYGEVFPHDVAMDQLDGVDFDKGCYVGQEVVSRMRHRGTARRRVVAVTGEAPLPSAGAEVLAGEKPVGVLGSSAEGRGIAIVRLDRAGEARAAGTALTVAGKPVALALPVWADYAWPEAA